MGNWTLQHAVQSVHDFMDIGCLLPRIFEDVFLMAADALEDPTNLRPILNIGHRVLVRHAENCGALQISEDNKGNPDRLGAGGPSGPTTCRRMLA